MKEAVKEKLINKIQYSDDSMYLEQIETFIRSAGFQNPKWLFFTAQKALAQLDEANLDLLLLVYYCEYDREMACAIQGAKDSNSLKNAEEIYSMKAELQLPAGYCAEFEEEQKQRFWLSLIKYVAEEQFGEESGFVQLQDARRRIQWKIQKYQKQMARDQKTFRKGRNVWRAVCVTVVVCALGFGTTLVTAEEFRNTLFTTIDHEDKVENIVAVPKDVLLEQQLEGHLRPTALLNRGYTISLAGGDLDHDYSLLFYKDGKEIFFDYLTIAPLDISDKEHSKIIQHEAINGCQANIVVQDGGYIHITVYLPGGPAYVVFGQMDLEDAKEIAESVA